MRQTERFIPMIACSIIIVVVAQANPSSIENSGRSGLVHWSMRPAMQLLSPLFFAQCLFGSFSLHFRRHIQFAVEAFLLLPCNEYNDIRPTEASMCTQYSSIIYLRKLRSQVHDLTQWLGGDKEADLDGKLMWRQCADEEMDINQTQQALDFPFRIAFTVRF